MPVLLKAWEESIEKALDLAQNRKLLSFDIDDTLVISKGLVTPEMAQVLADLTHHFYIHVISGGKIEQLRKSIADAVINAGARPDHFIVSPTSGGGMFLYENGQWRPVYQHLIPKKEREYIIKRLNETVKQAGIVVDKIWGEQIEDRGTQITFSALGQEAPPEEKGKFDPDGSKRKHIISFLEDLKEKYTVRIGGKSSIDVTLKGIDKAYGVRRVLEFLKIDKKDVLFFGDKLYPEGNDYPVYNLGVDSIWVQDWPQTYEILEALVKELSG